MSIGRDRYWLPMTLLLQKHSEQGRTEPVSFSLVGRVDSGLGLLWATSSFSSCSIFNPFPSWKAIVSSRSLNSISQRAWVASLEIMVSNSIKNAFLIKKVSMSKKECRPGIHRIWDKE